MKLRYSRRNESVQKDEGGMVADLSCNGLSVEETDRLGRLFAAAPELLEALKHLVEAHRQVVHCERTHVPAERLRAAESALAKAEGK